MTGETQPGGPPASGAPNRTPQLVVGAVVALAIVLIGAWGLKLGPFAPVASPSAAPSASVAPTGTATAAATGTPTTAPTATATAEVTDEPTASPTVAPTDSPSPSPTASPDACARDTLALKNPGRLTLSTDIPAFPPWVEGDASEQYPNEPEGGSPWSETDFSGEPYSGEGFEAATAYAVAEAMGFSPEEVDWIANPSFDLAFAPGPKPFDFHMAQTAITPERAEAVTFSDPYFDSNQSLLALSENEITSATSVAELKAFLLAAQQNTTSFAFIEDVIQPDVEPRVYPSNDIALAALAAGGADAPAGLIVDLATAFFMRDGQLDVPGTIVGQFGPPAEPDHVGFVMELDSPLAACVNQAIATIRADGTLDAILDEWINTGQEVPFLE